MYYDNIKKCLYSSEDKGLQ